MNIKESLHFWDKAHLVMMYDFFNMLLVHIHHGILLSTKKNSFESVLMRWMKLEPIIQSEVSQKDKD